MIRVAWLTRLTVLASVSLAASPAAGQVPLELRPWLSVQNWQRDTDGPVLSLGKAGEFDDTHIFAPAVANLDGGFQLWYCGSRGNVAERVFRLGRATSPDGLAFVKAPPHPVLKFQDGKRSVLTPTLLRRPNGRVYRESGKLRLWFSAANLGDRAARHTLHEATSQDGIHWSRPSPALLENVYAPTVIKIHRMYQMWYTDVSKAPWVIRHASSQDGHRWHVLPEPVLTIDQDWEQGSLFYPPVFCQ